MAYNNYNQNYGNRQGGNRGNDRRSNTPKEIEALPLPKNYVDEAEQNIKKLLEDRNKITTSKIRNLLSLISEVYNIEVLRTEDTICSESRSALLQARIRFVYEAGREEATKIFLEKTKLLHYLKGLEDKRESLIDFAHYMEALVAYHRFYIGGKEG